MFCLQRLTAYLHAEKKAPYVINLDPAVSEVPFPVNIDIQDTVKYKEVMKQYGLGPNGAIMTSLNLFTTKFDQVSNIRCTLCSIIIKLVLVVAPFKPIFNQICVICTHANFKLVYSVIKLPHFSLTFFGDQGNISLKFWTTSHKIQCAKQYNLASLYQ